jgi:hypothetical protein
LRRLRSLSVQRAWLIMLFRVLLTEGAAPAVKHDGHSTAFKVVINLVRSVPAIKSKSVAVQGGNNVAGGEIAKPTVVDLHGSDGDCDARFDGDLHLVGWFLRNVFPVFKHALYNHADDIMDVLEGFAFRSGPR